MDLPLCYCRRGCNCLSCDLNWFYLLVPFGTRDASPHSWTRSCGKTFRNYRVPDIDSADPGGQKPETIHGEITLEDVGFSYPSRPSVQVLNGVSLTFEAGKTAALVGAQLDPHDRSHTADRNALWVFIIAICSGITNGFQFYLFGSAAAKLTCKFRTISFKSILKQDIQFFDKEENSTGILTAGLSDNPRKVNGLAGITFGAIVQSLLTLVVGSIISLAFIWKVGLVRIACIPLGIHRLYPTACRCSQGSRKLTKHLHNWLVKAPVPFARLPP